MTFHHPAGSRQLCGLHRGKRLANIFRVTRRDGFVLRFTDHDRTLTIADETYRPINLISLSAEQRDAALREGNMEASGFVDGSLLTIPDLLGGLYRGATVRHAVVDWTMPWHEMYAVQKRVRQMHWDGSTWTAVLEGFGARMQQLVGGRFRGTTSPTCLYELGDETTCKAFLGFQTVFGATVDTIVDDRWAVTFTTGSWPTPQIDDYYRGGSVTWLTGANAGAVFEIGSYEATARQVELLIPTPFPIQAGDTADVRPGCDGLDTTCGGKFQHIASTGTATSATSTTLTDSSLSLGVGDLQYPGGAAAHYQWFLGIASGTGAGQLRGITNNTATQFTVSPAWTTTPDATSVYYLLRPNIVNFGGSPYDPGAKGVLEPPT